MSSISRSLRPLALSLLAASAIWATGCGEDPVLPGEPGMAEVAGGYSTGDGFSALSFTTTETSEGGGTVDWLAHGAELRLELSADGSCAGRLYIPVPPGELGAYFEEDDRARGHFEADMAGAWTLAGDVVRLQQEADSFMRDLELVWRDGVLTGERTFDGVRVRVVLVKD